MVVYLLHFDRPYQHAKHYLGSCQDLERRLTQHGKGRGARLLEVVQAVGIGWQLARTWCGGKHRERQLKKQGGASRLCPTLQGGPPCYASRNIVIPAIGPCGKTTSCSASPCTKRGQSPSCGACNTCGTHGDVWGREGSRHVSRVSPHCLVRTRPLSRRHTMHTSRVRPASSRAWPDALPGGVQTSRKPPRSRLCGTKGSGTGTRSGTKPPSCGHRMRRRSLRS